jgi:lysosomal Pro-X carboxypeptidase
MLAAWMRMKYPHVIQGSLAASAPVLLFKGANKIDLAGGFGKITSDDFNPTGMANDTCYNGMKDAFTRIITAAKNNDTKFIPVVAESFKTCNPVETAENVTALTDLIRNGFTYMAMTNYPYASSFLEPMPGYPVNVSCKAFDGWTKDKADKDVMVMLDAAA